MLAVIVFVLNVVDQVSVAMIWIYLIFKIACILAMFV